MSDEVVEKKELLSTCCHASISTRTEVRVEIGSCSICGRDMTRVNPKTHKKEWLDGCSAWTTEALRQVEVE